MNTIKIINKSNNPLPEYATPNSAGLDLRAHLETAVHLKPGERKLIPTGLFLELAEGFEAQIRPRSGLALKQGLTVLNTPGTIDADYRGEIGVVLINHGFEPAKIENGDRIAQMVITKYERVKWENAEVLAESSRGEGGFGHSGKQ